MWTVVRLSLRWWPVAVDLVERTVQAQIAAAFVVIAIVARPFCSLRMCDGRFIFLCPCCSERLASIFFAIRIARNFDVI